jgi:hypothetical protein
MGKQYTLIDTNTTNSTTPINISISYNISDIMVCYGKDNNGQAYGGGIIWGNRYYVGDKPCFLQVLDDSGDIGVLYIRFHYSDINYYRHSGSKILRVIIYGR